MRVSLRHQGAPIRPSLFRFRVLLMLGATVLGGLALGTASAGPAAADAVGTTSFGGKVCDPVKNICAPRGRFSVYTRSVGGSGRDVNYMAAGFIYTGPLCHWWIDEDVFSGGRNVYHLQGGEKGCSYGSGGEAWRWPAGAYYLAPAGSVHCATMYQRKSDSIVRLVRACNNL